MGLRSDIDSQFEYIQNGGDWIETSKRVAVIFEKIGFKAEPEFFYMCMSGVKKNTSLFMKKVLGRLMLKDFEIAEDFYLKVKSEFPEILIDPKKLN